jgi:IclR family transcriptional regulator, acetate operon repressor
MSTNADAAAEDVVPRAVVDGAFGLLTLLHGLGSARVSDLVRASGLPRTTVDRLLRQLEQVGAADRAGRRWRLGPRLVELGARVPAEPRLRAVARRPLMDLASATGALVALSVEMAGRAVVVDVLPGTRRLAYEPNPGTTLGSAPLAARRAHERARRGDLRPVVDAGSVDRRIGCVAAPLRLSPRDSAAVWLMVPGGHVPASAVAVTRRTAERIATHLSGGA